jgi:hypothetical protein
MEKKYTIKEAFEMGKCNDCSSFKPEVPPFPRNLHCWATNSEEVGMCPRKDKPRAIAPVKKKSPSPPRGADSGLLF